MKTRIEIRDPLLREARDLAARQGVTLREVVERALRRELAEEMTAKPFKLRDVSFGGGGLQPEFQGASWEKILEAAYEGRGGVNMISAGSPV